jgi:hypothetical protein
MSESVKASRSTVTLGSFVIDGFMLPNGEYRMSLSQAAEAVGLTARNAFDFLQSKTFKSLMGEGYTVSISEIESDQSQMRGQSRIRALPLEIVGKYWHWQSHRGNKQAYALVDALILETLERRFDRAFGITRSEDDWDRRMSDRIIDHMEVSLSAAYEEADVAMSRERLLEQQLRELGVEPWALPGEGESNI